MLWKHEPQERVFTDFPKSPKLSRIFIFYKINFKLIIKLFIRNTIFNNFLKAVFLLNFGTLQQCYFISFKKFIENPSVHV